MKRDFLKRITNKWTILSLLILVIVLGGAIYIYNTRQTVKKEDTVETSTIGTGDIILSATGIGSLANQEVSFGFKNSGKVSEVLVSLGDKVKAGDVLARLENGTLDLKYKEAEASYEALSSASEIAAAQQTLAEARQSFDTARDDLQHMIGPEMMVAEEGLT